MMLVSETEALTRLASPLNLINRLSRSASRNSSMGLFGINNKQTPQTSSIHSSSSANQIQPAAPVKQFISETEAVTTASLQSTNINEVKTPTLDNLIDNADSRIKLEHTHNAALEVLTDAVEMMKLKLDDIKPDKLPSVIVATNKVVESIRRERLEINKNNGNKNVNIIFYTPIQKTVEQYEVIDV